MPSNLFRIAVILAAAAVGLAGLCSPLRGALTAVVIKT
jgi:hypothetical protein